MVPVKTAQIMKNNQQNSGMPGCADGVDGDQLQLSPALIITEAEIDQAVERLRQSIEEVRNELVQQGMHSPGNKKMPG